MSFEKIVKLFDKLPIATTFGALFYGALKYLNGTVDAKHFLIYMGFVVSSVVLTEIYRAYYKRFGKKEKRD